jgi:hypothetical protein
MGWIIRTALAAGVAAVGIAASSAAIAQAPRPPATAPSNSSLDSIAGKKLVSIDGSAVTLTAVEGGLMRETTAANGAMRRTRFQFITASLGTVTDPADPNEPLGVFRIGKGELAIQYADGGVETMVVESGDRLLVATRAPETIASCVAWYPEGHVFSLEERKEAVAQYASRLGVAGNGDKESRPRSADPSCIAHGDLATASQPEKNALARDGTGQSLAALGLAAPALAALPNTAGIVALTTAERADEASRNASREFGATGVRVSGPLSTQPGSRAAPEQLTQSRRPSGEFSLVPDGASKCLSVESERGYRGFRNYCAYPVQFAYCVIGRKLQPDSCQYGAVQGSTEAWGFSEVGDRPLSAGNTPIELRWIACRGRAGDVLPRLERIDPPSGRCVSVTR